MGKKSHYPELLPLLHPLQVCVYVVCAAHMCVGVGNCKLPCGGQWMLGVFLCHGLSSEIGSVAESEAGCLASKLQEPTRLCSTQGVHDPDLEAENLNAGPLASPASSPAH